jgi:hypothetical protein
MRGFLVGLLISAAPSVWAQDAPAPEPTREKRIRILVNGSYNATGLDFSEQSTFESFLEEGESRRDYDGGKGFVFEVGAIVSVWKELGIMGSLEVYQSEVDATYEESLPHPLYFNEPRSAEGDVTGLSYDEKAFHLDAVYSRDFSSLTVDVFGGPTFFFTTTEVLGDVRTTSSYPFDEVVVSGTDTVELEDNPMGFNAGGALTFRLNDTVGLAVQARYSLGTVRIQREGGDEIELDAGGFRVGGGIRISF